MVEERRANRRRVGRSEAQWDGSGMVILVRLVQHVQVQLVQHVQVQLVQALTWVAGGLSWWRCAE